MKVLLTESGLWANRKNPGARHYSGAKGEIIIVDDATAEFMISIGHATDDLNAQLFGNSEQLNEGEQEKKTRGRPKKGEANE